MKKYNIKKLINILHWTPLGVLTVPYVLFFTKEKVDNDFLMANGIILGLEVGAVLGFILWLQHI